MEYKKLIYAVAVGLAVCGAAHASRGEFDMARWESVLDGVRNAAAAQNISDTTIKATLKNPSFIPAIVKNDANQSEFKLTLDQYLARTVSDTRIKNGITTKKNYPTMLARVEQTYGVPPHVIMAFWGLESNYGAVKARYKLTDAFFTLMYDGRRETFFTKQLLALMKIADDNGLDINNIYGSWAGATGHFQFIPTTLAQYGVDGNGDGRVDIINSVSDAMASAGNYLHKLGWNPNERIVRRVALPADFDLSLLNGDTRKTVSKWAAMGITNPDGTPLPTSDMNAGLVGDVTAIRAARDSSATDVAPDEDIAPQSVAYAYLTYPNFYRIKKWNNSNFYAIAIAELADRLK